MLLKVESLIFLANCEFIKFHLTTSTLNCFCTGVNIRNRVATVITDTQQCIIFTLNYVFRFGISARSLEHYLF